MYQRPSPDLFFESEIGGRQLELISSIMMERATDRSASINKYNSGERDSFVSRFIQDTLKSMRAQFVAFEQA